MNHTVPADSILWKNIQQNDVPSYNVLFERYWSAIYTTSFSYIKDSEVCANIVHDIFLNIWQKRHELEITSFKSYLTSAARYHVYKVMKTRSLNKLDFVEDYHLLPVVNPEENLGAQRIREHEFEDHLNDLLNHLPKRCQEIFIMSRKENLSNEDIAKKLGISKRTVENQITSALKYIRLNIKDISFLILFLMKL